LALNFTATTFTLNSAATTNATAVKATPAKLLYVHAFNANAAVRYLKLYNKATAPTIGTDRPIMAFPIPATGAISIAIGDDDGVLFSAGLGLGLVTGAADTDTAAVAVNDIKVVLAYA
jgi:hypothetical protein